MAPPSLFLTCPLRVSLFLSNQLPCLRVPVSQSISWESLQSAPSCHHVLPLSSSATGQPLLSPWWPWTVQKIPQRLFCACDGPRELGIPRMVSNPPPYTHGGCSSVSPRNGKEEWPLYNTGLRAQAAGFITVCCKILRDLLGGIREAAGGCGVNTSCRRRHSKRLSYWEAKENQLPPLHAPCSPFNPKKIRRN